MIAARVDEIFQHLKMVAQTNLRSNGHDDHFSNGGMFQNRFSPTNFQGGER